MWLQILGILALWLSVSAHLFQGIAGEPPPSVIHPVQSDDPLASPADWKLSWMKSSPGRWKGCTSLARISHECSGTTFLTDAKPNCWGIRSPPPNSVRKSEEHFRLRRTGGPNGIRCRPTPALMTWRSACRELLRQVPKLHSLETPFLEIGLLVCRLESESQPG